mgnify:FL=1
MSDKLDWLNQHFVLLRPATVAEAQQAGYVLSPEAEPLALDHPSSEDFLRALVQKGLSKPACDFLAAALHPRAAVWWVYLVNVTLESELRIKPHQPKRPSDIGKPKPVELPEWAKMPPPENPADIAAQFEPVIEKLKASLRQIQALIPPETQKRWDAEMAKRSALFREKYGMDPMEALKMAVDKFDPAATMKVDEANSPIFKAERELKEKIEAMRQETAAFIESVMPPVPPEKIAAARAAALDAVWNWVLHPGRAEAQAALNAANKAPDQPTGLLAYAAFWSFGNLDLTGKLVIPSPPGLSAKGLSASILQASLMLGGTRKYKARLALYLELGLETAAGRLGWEAYAQKGAIHRYEAAAEPDRLAAMLLKTAAAAPNVEPAPATRSGGRFRTPPKF